ncbi:uncharacterized protein ACA1_367220 [Acanthamoeba castellanii str. Neff]|uniref:Uncharacterized protein n=1 Tax=Acanthamoeba castellanii (strain ATCC 30010 / Neff) TaxID=1257118 RepID=L8GMQ2_ACACF|nr:uncharacterized protein ACA1_367220 [Acanthamoeba castellanii str. Neff]ELR14089.1 hypothetical protein ACA1_367220 [Acanthamoeba castellanii str. Neff]
MSAFGISSSFQFLTVAADENYYVGNLFRGEENLDYYPQVAAPGYGPYGYADPQQPGGYLAEVPKPQQAYYPPPQGYAAPQAYPQTYGQPLQSPGYGWQQGGGYPQPAYQAPRSYMEQQAVATPTYEEYEGPRAESMPTETQMRGGHHDQKKKKGDDHHTSLSTGLQALMGAGKLFSTGVDVLAALNNLT